MSDTAAVSPADVLAMTGVTVTDAQLDQALSIIEIYASIDLSNFAQFNARNRKWLHMAVCYQAAWMVSQPDLFARHDVMSQMQDKQFNFTSRDQTSLFLAPFARKALSRVTWMRPRTIYVGQGRHVRTHDRLDGLRTGTGYLPVGAPYTDSDFDRSFYGNDEGREDY